MKNRTLSVIQRIINLLCIAIILLKLFLPYRLDFPITPFSSKLPSKMQPIMEYVQANSPMKSSSISVEYDGTSYKDTGSVFQKDIQIYISIFSRDLEPYGRFPSIVFWNSNGFDFERLQRDMESFQTDASLSKELSEKLNTSSLSEKVNCFVIKADGKLRVLASLEDESILSDLKEMILTFAIENGQNSIQLDYIMLEEKDLIHSAYDFFACFDTHYSDAIQNTATGRNPYFILHDYLTDHRIQTIIIQ